MWRGALGGMLMGVAAAVIYYLYMQFTDPNPYNGIYIFYIPIAAIMGGIIGLFAAAWYNSD